MSDRMLHRVFDHSRATGSAYAVMLALADFFNDSEGCARPSLASLARKARLSRATAARAVRGLEALGEVRTASGATKGTISRYVITVHGKDRGDRITPSQPAITPSQPDTPPRLNLIHPPSQVETQTDQRTDQKEQINDQRLPALAKMRITTLWKAEHGRALNAAQLAEMNDLMRDFVSAGKSEAFPALIHEAAVGGWRVPLFLKIGRDRLDGRDRNGKIPDKLPAAKGTQGPLADWTGFARAFGEDEAVKRLGPKPKE